MKKDNFRLNYTVDNIDPNKTVEAPISTEDLYNIGGLLDHPIDYTIGPDDITGSDIIEPEEPIIDETSISEDELIDNPQEEKIVEEAIEQPTKENIESIDETVDNPEEQKSAEKLQNTLGVKKKEEATSAATEKVGSNLWDTVIKGV